MLAKFCTEPVQDYLGNASGVHIDFPGLAVKTVPFQLELGRDLFSVDRTNIGPSPSYRNCGGESRCFHLALPRDSIWAVFPHNLPQFSEAK